jgi:hypothetical protein
VSHPERVEDYLEHIAGAIERAIRYTGSLESLAALEQDEQAQDAIVRTLTVIGEAAVIAWDVVWDTYPTAREEPSVNGPLAEALHMPGAAEVEFNPSKADWMPKPAEFD